MAHKLPSLDTAVAQSCMLAVRGGIGRLVTEGEEGGAGFGAFSFSSNSLVLITPVGTNSNPISTVCVPLLVVSIRTQGMMQVNSRVPNTMRLVYKQTKKERRNNSIPKSRTLRRAVSCEC